MNTRITKRFFGGRGVAAIGGFLVATCAAWSLMAGAALAAGPALVTAPSISGALTSGGTLTVSNGTWNPPDPGGVTGYTYSYAWTSGGTAVGTNSSYTVAPTDIVTDRAGTGRAPDPAVTGGSTSAPPVSAGVVPTPPANTVAPSISGVAQQGQTLTANTGTWSGTVPITFIYQWTSGGAPVGTDSPSYLVTPTDVGKLIAVGITASNAGGGPVGPVSSPAVGPALPLPPTNSTPPTITGTAQQGQVLTLTSGWINSPTSFTEQWEDCTGASCTLISGPTGTSYTVGPGDVGHTIEVVETAFNAAAPLGVAATSGPTGTVSTTSTTSVVAFTQNGPTTNQGVTLIATVTSNSSNANPHGSLSFLDGLGAISGCSGMPVNGGGQTITVVCQASFGAGTAQVSAAYVADPTSLVNGSSSSATPLGVRKGGTSVLLAVTPKVAPGGSATYLATLMVPASNAGPRLPGGSIEFLDGGQPIGTCASQSLSNLTATCTVSYKSPGTHTISALYTGDANFTGSTSSTSGVQIVKGAPKTPTVHGSLGSTLAWTIYYHPRYSEFTIFKAFAVAKGTSIIVHCYGKDCPFAKWSLAKPSSTLSLLRRFRHRHLRAGTRITVRLIRTHWFGWYYSFTMRAGRAPLTKRTCIAPGTLKPGCTSRHR
jgi:hypothetical protein